MYVLLLLTYHDGTRRFEKKARLFSNVHLIQLYSFSVNVRVKVSYILFFQTGHLNT